MMLVEGSIEYEGCVAFPSQYFSGSGKYLEANLSFREDLQEAIGGSRA